MSDSFQTDGLESGDLLSPLVNRGSGNAESAGYRGLIAVEMLKYIGAAHECAEYTAVDPQVNCSRRCKVSAGAPASTIGYSAMAGRHRVRPMKHFNGQVIRDLRLGRNLSQDQLAEVVKTKKANISKWERARKQIEISYDLFLNLAAALYIAPEELARRLSAPTQPSGPTASSKGSSGPIKPHGRP